MPGLRQRSGFRGSGIRGRTATLPDPLLLGLSDYYGLDDLRDAIGNRPLTNINSVVFTAGKRGNCAAFSGLSTARLNRAGLNMGDTGYGMSVSLWFRTNESSGLIAVLIGEDTTVNPAWRVQVSGTNKVLSLIRSGASTLTATPTPLINDSRYHHLVMTYNSVDFKLRAYLDGAVPTLSSVGSQAAVNTNNVGFHIGGDGTSNFGQNTIAEIDEVMLWSARCIGDAEAAALFNNQAGAFL